MKKVYCIVSLLRDFGSIFHCKLFQLVQIVYRLSTDINFHRFSAGLQSHSRLSVSLSLLWGHYLVARPSDDLRQDRSMRFSHYPSKCQHFFFFFQKTPWAWIGLPVPKAENSCHQHIYLWELCSLGRRRVFPLQSSWNRTPLSTHWDGLKAEMFIIDWLDWRCGFWGGTKPI